MKRQTFKVEGLKELDRALGQLPKATGKAVLRRTLKAAGEPIRAAAERLAPFDTGALYDSFEVGTKLSRRQASLNRRVSTVEMYVGPGPNPQAITQEFGTIDQPAQPFMRPAWDANKEHALTIIKRDLADNIQDAAYRLARKAARAGG